MPLRSILDNMTCLHVAYEAPRTQWWGFRSPAMGSRSAVSRLVLSVRQLRLRQTLAGGTPAQHCLVTKHNIIDLGGNGGSDSNRSTFVPTRDAPKASSAFRPEDVLLFDALRRACGSTQLQQSDMRACHQGLHRGAANATHRQLRCSRAAAAFGLAGVCLHWHHWA
jgi:hypothetical protein